MRTWLLSGPRAMYRFPDKTPGVFEGALRFGRGSDWNVHLFVEMDDGEIQEGTIPLSASKPVVLNFAPQLPKYQEGPPADLLANSLRWISGGAVLFGGVVWWMLRRRRTSHGST